LVAGVRMPLEPRDQSPTMTRHMNMRWIPSPLSLVAPPRLFVRKPQHVWFAPSSPGCRGCPGESKSWSRSSWRRVRSIHPCLGASTISLVELLIS
jgi:hypothetical protein